MSLSSLQRRLARLETLAHLGQSCIILLFADGRRKEREISRGLFYRLCDAICDPSPADHKKSSGVVPWLYDLRRCTELHESDGHMFALVRALALPPEGD